jgi:two-component system, NarL family, response regulator DevR
MTTAHECVELPGSPDDDLVPFFGEGSPHGPAGHGRGRAPVSVVLVATRIPAGFDAVRLGVEVRSAASSASDACWAVRRERPDVVLIHLPDLSSSFWALDLCRRVRALGEKVSILVWGPQLAHWFVHDAAQLGVRGCLGGTSDAELSSAIGVLARGGVVLDGPAARADPLSGTPARPPLSRNLSPQQSCVLKLMAGGKSNEEIAAELAISASTAKFHVRNVIHKLGPANRTEAVYRAARLQLC